MPLFITRLGHYLIVPGIPWLQRHNPFIKFSTNSLIFNSSFCTNHCLPDTELRYTTVQRIPEIATQPKAFTPTAILDPSLPPLSRPLLSQGLSPKPNIYMIGASAFQFLARRPGAEIFTLSINAINHAVQKHTDSDIKIALKRKTPVDLFSKLRLSLLCQRLFSFRV